MTRPRTEKRGKEIELFRVSYFWTEPDRPPIRLPHGWKDGEPFLETEVLQIPRPGDALSILLPGPATVGFAPGISQVYGRVAKTEKLAGRHHRVLLERQGRVGLEWDALFGFIGARAVGYHDDIGRVEGELIGLLPGVELAGLRVPELLPILEAILQSQIDEGVEDQEMLDSLDEDDVVIWVSWSSLLPVSVIDRNPVRTNSAEFPPGKHTDPPTAVPRTKRPSRRPAPSQPSPLADYATFAAALDAERQFPFPAGPGEPCFILAAFEGASALARRYADDAARGRDIVFCDVPPPSPDSSRKSREIMVRLLKAFGSRAASQREDTYEMDRRLCESAKRIGADLLIVASIENFVTPARRKPLLREFYRTFAYLKSAVLTPFVFFAGDDSAVVKDLVRQDMWIARRIRLLRE